MLKAAWILTLCTCAAAASDVVLTAGLARVELTPPGSLPMYGYANRKCGDASGTHDPLWAKALVLSTGESRVAIVSVELGMLVSDKLREQVADKLGIPVLLLAATHTHSSPRLQSSDGSAEASSPYLTEVENRIFGAVERAAASMFPARLTTGRGALRLGYNRLLLRDDGRARALFENLERIPYGPLDDEFMLLGIEDQKGSLRALLINYAVHPVVLGPTNCKYSADYPGVMQARVEAAMPGVQAMFVLGGAGDINPLFLARSGDEQKDFAVVAKMGETLAAEVLRAAKSMTPTPRPQQALSYTSEALEFPERWEQEKRVRVGITTVWIPPAVAIAAVPGEPLHLLQRTWKEQAEVAFPLFFGYTWSGNGGWPGYLPDIRSAAYGGYGADVTTRVAVGAGETIMQRHLIQLYGLMGMWKDKPGRP